MFSSLGLIIWRALAILSLLLIGSPYPSRVQGAQMSGPTDPNELEAFLDKFFTEQMETLHIPGAVFVLVKDGKIFFPKGYGYANLDEKKPVIPDKTLFRVASISKLFTATAMMQLYEQGRLRLDDDVNKYLTLFQLEKNYSKPVTVANLLTHTGGFDERSIGMVARSESQVVPLGQYLAQGMPRRVMPPGEVTSYSNHGFALAGYLVEAISGIPFAQYIDENILQPLGMGRSSFLLSPRLAPDLAAGYVYENGSHRPLPVDYPNGAPASSLVTTATDIAHFMIAHLQDGRYGNSRILKEATAQEMHRQHFTHHPRLPGVAYSFFEHLENNQRAIVHDGGVRGFASLLFLLPEQNLGFFVASNTWMFGGDQGKLHHQLVRQFLDRYYPVKEHFGSPKPPADFRNRARRFTGSYRSSRYARHSIEKVATLLGEVRVTDNGDGTLTVRFPGDFLEPHRGVEVAPLLFQRIGGDGYGAFREDRNGRITHLFIGPFAFERLSWYETAAFHLSLIGFFVLVFLSGCAVWPAGYLIRRLRNKPLQVARFSRLARALACLIGLLNVFFLVGLAWTLLQVDLYEFTYGVPSALIVLLFIPLLTTSLAIGLLILTVLAWKDKFWSLIGRLHHSLVTLATLAFIPFLLYWNLLGLRF